MSERYAEKLRDEYEESTVAEVGPGDAVDADGSVIPGFAVRASEGWSLIVPRVEGAIPVVGSVIRTYGKGFGFPVRGVDIDGVEVYYRTEAEERQRHRAWVAVNNEEKKATAEREKGRTIERIAALPDIMRRRLQKFTGTNPNFWWEFMPYELMVCEDAVKIADAIRAAAPAVVTGDALLDYLKVFAAGTWEKQVEAVPGLDPGHSGNSFGCAVRLARHLLVDPEMAVLDHGALTPLVGCEAYGCPHPAEPS